MPRLSPLLFVIALCASLPAQSKFDEPKTAEIKVLSLLAQSRFDPSKAAAAEALISTAKYCDDVEDYAGSQDPRIFARITSVPGRSAGWVEFDARAAWNRAGRPKPVALVWYRDAKIV